MLERWVGAAWLVLALAIIFLVYFFILAPAYLLSQTIQNPVPMAMTLAVIFGAAVLILLVFT